MFWLLGGRVLHRYVARINVDHYLSLLSDGDLAPQKRSAITKRLIAEEDKFGHDLEHLDFAEIRAARGREKVHQFKKLRERFASGTTERELAERLLANVENIQTLLEDFCHRLREKVNLSGI